MIISACGKISAVCWRNKGEIKIKKLLNTLYITEEDAYLSLDGENIVIKLPDEQVFQMPFSNIESVFCFSYMGCSPALMGKLCEYGIALNFLSPQGRLLGRLQGTARGNVLLRTAQIKLFVSDDDTINEKVLGLIRNTVSAKIANSCSVLKRSLRDYPEIDSDGAISSCIERLKGSAESVFGMNDKLEILGTEGSAAKAYFEVFDRMLIRQREDFRMSYRTKRPPLDRINALLSYLYTICTCDYAAALESVGLDSFVGYYHELRPGRSSLACDLVEETRCIIERMVITVINLRQIKAEDFEEQPGGAVMLTKDGKKKVLSLWQEKKRSVIAHPFLKQKIPLGLLPFVQSSLLAKYVRGELDEYPSFLLK